MELPLAGVVRESCVDGEGFRYALFTQGCPHHCPGCHNPQTWAMEGGTLKGVSEIMEEVKRNPLLQGVTFSGGEPFLHVEALCELADAAHAEGLDVWSWTGYTYDEILADEEKRKLLDRVDVLVDGPFVLDERDLSLRFRGSRNQRVIDVKKSRAAGVVVLWCED